MKRKIEMSQEKVTKETMDQNYPPGEFDRRVGYVKHTNARIIQYAFLAPDKDSIESPGVDTDVFLPMHEFKANISIRPGDKIQFRLYEHSRGWRAVDAVHLREDNN